MTQATAVRPDIDFAHTGRDTRAGKFLRRFWLPVALLDDIPPGRAKWIKVLNELFTFYRGESGEPHLVGFYCAHRSTQMSTGWVEGEEIRCFYHGWKFNADGDCTDQPAEADAFARKVHIGGYPTRVYLGLVYAYLGEGAPPEFPRIGAIDAAAYVSKPRSLVRYSNYFNGLENSCDQIHVNFAHRNSRYRNSGIHRAIPKIEAVETDYGIIRKVSFGEGDDSLRIAHTLMPTGSLVSTFDVNAGWVQHVSYRIPIDDDSHISFSLNGLNLEAEELNEYISSREERFRQIAELPPAREVVDAVLRGDIYLHELDRPDIVNLQDEIALAAQPPIGSRPADRLGVSDVQIIELRKIYAREIRAIAAGEQTKTWSSPGPEVIATGGS